MPSAIFEAGNVDQYISSKLEKARGVEKNFDNLFQMMFSERDEVLWETNDGFSIYTTTYGQCKDRILRRAVTLAEKLEACGIGRDRAIGLYMENSLDWIEVFWCILLCGCRPLLLNLRMSDSMLTGALDTVCAAAVISDGKAFPGCTIQAREITEADTQMQCTACGGEILLLSSGTSGSVKICAYTAKEIFAQVSAAAGVLRENKRMQRHYEGSIKQLMLLPLYHVFGLFAVYFWFGFFSRTFVYLPNMNPDTVLNTVRKHKVTHIFAVPMFWDTVYRSAMKTIRARGEKTLHKFEKGMRLAEKWGDAPGIGKLFTKIAFRQVRENMFGESIQFCITGGSAIRAETLAFFNGIGYHLANGYGMTEIGITSVELSEKKRMLNSGSIGRAMSSVRYTKLESGELEVCGESIASAIIEDGVRREIANRTIRTKDLVRVEDGHYFTLGRMDDVIISPTGENLNPDVVEQMLDLPETQGFCLIPAQEDSRVIPVLVVSVKRYMSPEWLAALRERIQRQLEANRLSGQIGRIEFVTDGLMLPQEIKVNRKRLARNYQEGRLHPAQAGARGGEEARTMLEERVVQLMAETLDKQDCEISPEGDFFLDYGGTSIDYYVLMGKVRDEFDADLYGEPEKRSTARAICMLIEERLKA